MNLRPVSFISTAQYTPLPLRTGPKQPLSETHWAGVSSPFCQRLMRKGSRISGRLMDTKSAVPSPTTSRAVSRERIPPTRMTGTCTDARSRPAASR